MHLSYLLINAFFFLKAKTLGKNDSRFFVGNKEWRSQNMTDVVLCNSGSEVRILAKTLSSLRPENEERLTNGEVTIMHW